MQRQRRPKINFRENFRDVRFSTFATISALNGRPRPSAGLPLFGVKQKSASASSTSESDPTATLAVQCGNGFHPVSSPINVPDQTATMPSPELGSGHETARFDHAFRRRGSYVAVLGPGAAIGQDEADRFRFAFAPSQRNELERPTVLPRFFRGAKSPWLRRGPKPRSGALLWRRATRTLCRTGPRCRQNASRLDCSAGRYSIVRLQNGDYDNP